MGFFKGLFSSRDAPKNKSTTGQNYAFYWGSATSGKKVTARSAMQMTGVYACVRVLAEAIAELPLYLYEYTDRGRKRAVNHPLYRLLHDEPNPEMTSFIFRETLMSHLLLWGNAYAQIIRNARGDVVALYPLMPDRMDVCRDEDSGKIYYSYTVMSDNEEAGLKAGMLCSGMVMTLGFRA